MIVLDASALLAYLFKETGHEVVAQYIDDCCLSTVNLSEVIGRFARDGHDPQQVFARLSAAGMEFVPFTAVHATCANTL
jgi:PIN domain nuclease of toxin-antitoxin system